MRATEPSTPDATTIGATTPPTPARRGVCQVLRLLLHEVCSGHRTKHTRRHDYRRHSTPHTRQTGPVCQVPRPPCPALAAETGRSARLITPAGLRPPAACTWSRTVELALPAQLYQPQSLNKIFKPIMRRGLPRGPTPVFKILQLYKLKLPGLVALVLLQVQAAGDLGLARYPAS